jgi:hypothetical protein
VRNRAEAERRAELLGALESLSGVSRLSLDRISRLDAGDRAEIEQRLQTLRNADRNVDQRVIDDEVAALRDLTGLDGDAIRRLAYEPEQAPQIELLLTGQYRGRAEAPGPASTPVPAAAAQPQLTRQEQLQAMRARANERVLQGGRESSFQDATADPAWAARLTLASLLASNRNVTDFDAFLATPEVSQLLSHARPLSGADRSRFEAMHQQARADADSIAALGRQLGLRDEVVENFFALWARHPDRSVDQLMGAMREWAQSPTGRAGRFREFPASMLDVETRELLAPVDLRVSSATLPQHLSARRTTEGGLAITVEAPLLPGALSRTPVAGQARAPNFNAAVRRALRNSGFFAAAGLDPASWQVMHLVGPSSGVEVAAGLVLGPTTINVELQTRRFQNAEGIIDFEGVEVFMNDLAVRAMEDGGSVWARSTVVTWPPGQLDPRFVTPHVEFFQSVEYQIHIARADGTEQVIVVRIAAERPPAHSATLEILGQPIVL